MRVLRAAVLVASVALHACSEMPGAAQRWVEPAFDRVFRLESQVVLDDRPEATIGRMGDLLVVPDRGLYVADAFSNRILRFTSEGEFVDATGRLGDGPGEFERPRGLLLEPDSTILVHDVTQRITRLSLSLDLLDVRRLDVPNFVGGAHRVGDDLVVRFVEPRAPGDNFGVLGSDGAIVRTFDPKRPEPREVPYWSAVWAVHLAVGTDRLFVADNMLYPLRVLSRGGELLDSLGTPPGSWRQASRPERGEFAGVRQAEARSWTRSFTRIRSLSLLDERWLVVEHEDPRGPYPEDALHRADLYDAGTLTKVAEDVTLPGPVVSADGCLWIALARPPEPWTLGCFRVAGPAGAQ